MGPLVLKAYAGVWEYFGGLGAFRYGVCYLPFPIGRTVFSGLPAGLAQCLYRVLRAVSSVAIATSSVYQSLAGVVGDALLCKAPAQLKRAPVPVTWHAERDLRLCLPGRGRARARHRAGGDRTRWHRAASVLLLRGPVATATATYTRGLAVTTASAPPQLEVAVAVCAGAAELTARVIVGALVQGNLIARVRVAKDVAAAPAVVPPHEVVEVLLAGRVVTDFGFRIGL